MVSRRTLSVAIVVVIFLLVFLDPIVPVKTISDPYCTLHTTGCPISLTIGVPGKPMYFSLMAYLLNFGAYYDPNYGYGYGLVMFDVWVCLAFCS